LALILITFLLEDVAIAAGVALAAQGTIGWGESFLAVAFGIAIGDLGLYALGVAARKWPWLYQHYLNKRHSRLESYVFDRLVSAVFLARVIPGLRLLTYVYCGFVKVPFIKFATWVSLAVIVWTASLYVFSLSIGEAIAKMFHIPLSIAVMVPVLVFAVIAHFIGSRNQKRNLKQAQSNKNEAVINP
jgi:membrane protein DedA with SNARE-associated domain